MKKVTVFHYDAFTTMANKGNPAGVVFDGDGLTDEEMQQIAFQVGFNETTFVQSSKIADVRLRFFTPGYEMNLCGHATMATMYALFTRGMLEGVSDSLDHLELVQETKAGLLPICISKENQSIRITMKQSPAQFKPFTGSVEAVAASMGLGVDDIDDDFPIVYGSTGIWTLIVPIKRLSSFSLMKPNNQLFPEVLEEIPRASLHPFCLETIDPSADMHGRHFSSPYAGTIEDPVTGTASGVMGAYYAKYIKPGHNSYRFMVEQGQEMGRDGRVNVMVDVEADQYDVSISGEAVFVRQFEVQI